MFFSCSLLISDRVYVNVLRYREALEPKTQCLEQLTVRAMYTVQGETPSDSKARLKSETMMIREFMSFVVTRLQVATPFSVIEHYFLALSRL